MKLQPSHHSCVQSASPADAHSIAVVHVASWQSAYKGLMPDEVLTNLSVIDRAQRWLKVLASPDHGLLKQVIDSRVIGFSHATSSKDDDAVATTADIHAIYLAPEFIGKGYGKELMQETLRRLKERGFVTATLWAIDTNHAAIRFYLSQGFIDDQRSGPYRLAGDYIVTIKRYRINFAEHIE